MAKVKELEIKLKREQDKNKLLNQQIAQVKAKLPKEMPTKINTKNDLYIRDLLNVQKEISKLIKQIETLDPQSDGVKFDELQNKITRLEELLTA